MSGSGFVSSPSSTFQGEPAPFSDVIIPPSDYTTSAYLEPASSRPNSGTSNQGTTRQDSGIVEDGQRSVPTTPRSLSSSQPRIPAVTQLEQIPEMPGMKWKRPESLAVRGHDYEELPTARQDYSMINSDNEPLGNSKARPPVMTKLQPLNSRTDSDNFSQHSAPPMPTYRKRQNPLYNSSDHEDVGDSSKTLTADKAQRSSRCPCLCWLLLLLVALAALCLSLYNFTQNHMQQEEVKTAMLISSPNNKTFQQVLNRLQKLEEENKQLVNKVQELLMVSQMQDEINRNTSLELDSLYSKLDTIEKLPGPAGAGNLSQCEHLTKSGGGLTSDPLTETAEIPENALNYLNYVILGMECTSEGGTQALLSETKPSPLLPQPQYNKYKCVCKGQDTGASPYRYCELHYWQCPRIS